MAARGATTAFEIARGVWGDARLFMYRFPPVDVFVPKPTQMYEHNLSLICHSVTSRNRGEFVRRIQEGAQSVGAVHARKRDAQVWLSALAQKEVCERTITDAGGGVEYVWGFRHQLGRHGR